MLIRSYAKSCREFTGHNAPMISTDSEMAYGPSHPGYMYNVFDSVNLYIDGGIDASKIVLGMPLYGRGWELVDPESNSLLRFSRCQKVIWESL